MIADRSPRIQKLVEQLYLKLPEIEPSRAVILTESFKATENLPITMRRALAFAAILDRIPITIRPHELIVGVASIAPRGCQTFPEFSHEWLEKEFDTIAERIADPFYISEPTKKALKDVHSYWKGKTTSDLAAYYMAPEAKQAMDDNIFTVGNYFYNGVGHLCVQYDKVLKIGYEGIIAEAQELRDKCKPGDADYASRTCFLDAVIISCKAVIRYALRYSELANKMADKCDDLTRKQELIKISENCRKVPAQGASNFHEACQSFWFVQLLVQTESSGHSISPGRFDQYMNLYYKGEENAQELLDCIWVKFNELNKVRDAASAEGFSGYGLFQNLIVGGQNEAGTDASNDISYMCIEATRRVFLPQPSLSVRVWNGTPHKLLLKAAELTRTGIGLPAYFNDEVIIPSIMNRGLSLADARDYCIIGCVEPQKGGKTDGWHDAAFFNMCRPLELLFSADVESITSYELFFEIYKELMSHYISLLVNANNAVDMAHAERAPMPWLSCMVEDCLANGKTVQEGGAHYNFTGPQGFGIANVADGLYAVKKLVFEEERYSLSQFKQAIAANFSGFSQLLEDIETLPKFGNDIDEVDQFAREAAYTYTRPMEQYKNPRGGIFQAGLYPVSANVPLGLQTGATPDGRLAGTPIADGVSPSAGKDIKGPTAAANSVAKLDHFIASNGTLFNQKFHPSALEGSRGLNNFISLIRSFFDQKGMHVQFNIVDRDTLIAAQQNPEQYKNLIVRVAGYSALFTTLSKSLQDDIIRRTEQGL